ncbi:MAG: hypothetical protein LBI04_02710 [Treponema sp.]|jgi:hypothetical protein|nr:hypothetical protein [Treponema sp.]
MKKIPVLIIIFSLLLFACLIDEDRFTPGNFWAQNFSTSSFYRVNAQLLAENDLCCVWAERGSGVTESTAQRIADTYKYDIYNKMMDTFGYMIDLKDDNGETVTINTMQYANYLATGNLEGGKLTILLLDIKDDYRRGVNDSYVAGYFWSGNLFSLYQVSSSNECNMIYIDTNPGIPGSKESNGTLAHEMQHLMNFAGSVAKREKHTDLWIDEGLSSAAEWVYSNEHPAQRLKWYNEDGSGLLASGNNFFVWGNREGKGKGEDPNAVLDDYSTVYLFFQWLRLQAGNDIYRKISSSEDYDYNAVIKAFNAVSTNGYSNWKTMLGDWLAANYIKSSTGRYGYRNDTALNNIERHYTPGGSTSISLSPGEGVYSIATGVTSIPQVKENINYAGLTGSAPIPSGSFANGALLTYNANTAANGNKETGTITGTAPPASPSANISSERSVSSAGPFPISAGDMLRQNGKNSDFYSDRLNFKIPDAYRGIIVNE